MKPTLRSIFSVRWSVETDTGRDLGIDEIRLFKDFDEAESFKQLLVREYSKVELVCKFVVCEHRVIPYI